MCDVTLTVADVTYYCISENERRDHTHVFQVQESELAALRAQAARVTALEAIEAEAKLAKRRLEMFKEIAQANSDNSWIWTVEDEMVLDDLAAALAAVPAREPDGGG